MRLTTLCTLTVLLSACSRPAPESSRPSGPPPPSVTPQATAPADLRPRRALETTLPFVDPLPEPPEKTATDLFERGDALASGGKLAEALSWWRWGTVYTMPAMRELTFQYPVTAEFMPRDQLRERMQAELDKEWPDDAMTRDQRAWAAMGLIPDDVELGTTLANLLADQVAGFYDPDSKELVLIAEPDKKKGLWGKLLDFGGEADEQKMILSHELAHALADQHFDLLSLQRSTKHDDDMALAFSGLVEGEAMVVMVLSVLPPEARGNFLFAPSELMSSMMQLVMPVVMSFAGGDSWQETPRYLQESLVLPYLEGMTFVQHVLQKGGSWDAVNRAFRDPPISSEQLLHPERFAPMRDVPTALTLPVAPPALADYELVKQNTLGEFGIRVKLRDAYDALAEADRPAPSPAEAAAGWDGDTYAVYAPKNDADPLCVVWITTWDSENDAAEFERALAAAPVGSRGRIWRSASDVYLIDGAPVDGLGPLSAWLEASTRGPKTFELKKFEAKTPFPNKPDERIRAQSAKPGGAFEPMVPAVVRTALSLTGDTDPALVDKTREVARQACACEDHACVHGVLHQNMAWIRPLKDQRLGGLDGAYVKYALERILACARRFPKPEPQTP